MDNDFKYIKTINNILPVVEKKWVYNDNCYKCNSEFGSIMNRQHHCRCCGKSFCWNCCHNKIDFSEDLIGSPKEEKTYKKSLNSFFGYKKRDDDNKLVCDICYSKLWNINKLEVHIIICGFLDLRDLLNVMSVSKKYYDSSIYWLYKFRKIQINHESQLNKWESNILKSSIKYFYGHSVWIKESIKVYLIERYNQNENISTLSFDAIVSCISNNKNISCESMNCYKCCQNSLNVYDLIEVIENIVYLENKNSKIFWKNYGLRSNLKMIIQKISQPNNSIIRKILPLFTILLLKLLNTAEEIDFEFVHMLFDFILLDSKKICFILNDIELLKNSKYNNENSSINFISCLEKYIEKKNINIKDILLKLKNLRDFTVNIYYYHNLSNINSKLPLIYYFDYDMEIIEINQTMIYKNNQNSQDYALFVSAKVKYLSKTINKKFLIRRTANFNEYYISNLMKILRDKMTKYTIENGFLMCDVPICDVILISNNFLVVELPDEGVFLSDLYSKRMNLKDYLCHTASSKTVEKMMNNFISSLSFMTVLGCSFNLKIKDPLCVMINKKEQVFITNHNQINEDEWQNSLYVINSMIDILGPRKGYHFEKFAKKTIELYDILRIQNNFINSYMRVIFENLDTIYFEKKSINDIKITKHNL